MGFSYRQIAEDYKKAHPGLSISHQVIYRKSKAEGWQRDLSEDYSNAVDRKLIERAKGDKGDGIERSDQDVVDEAAEVAAGVVEKHRKDADKLREAAMRIITEVDDNEAVTVVTRNGDKVTIQADVTKRAQALNNASRALSQAVDIERKSLNLDQKEGASFGFGSFTIISNVPLPDPLPPGI
jgi:hypothetical protein